MRSFSANKQNVEKKPFGTRRDQQLLLEKAHSRQDRCSLSAKWEPARFFSEISWRGFNSIQKILKKLKPHRWGRGQPHAGCQWHVGSCSSRRFPRCRSPSTAPSGVSSINTIVNLYHSCPWIWWKNGWWCTLSLLPFTFLDSMWTRLRPSSSNTLRALESPTMPLKVMEVDLLRITEDLTLCRGNITAVLKTPSRLRKW